MRLLPAGSICLLSEQSGLIIGRLIIGDSIVSFNSFPMIYRKIACKPLHISVDTIRHNFSRVKQIYPLALFHYLTLLVSPILKSDCWRKIRCICCATIKLRSDSWSAMKFAGNLPSGNAFYTNMDGHTVLKTYLKCDPPFFWSTPPPSTLLVACQLPCYLFFVQYSSLKLLMFDAFVKFYS